ncbi:hypothetical protein HFN_2242 [Helicobacter fennelliae MRY12-0050]|uniref:Uncharacterized protein n=1 Tax=Helicobacter fennelliae MRY12-0050 TaxID=1325130 RepID=T1CY04_9HELI|nr:hypothetical protein HFN_2242 [Helicobacter fennelliae MRY12-0050]
MSLRARFILAWQSIESNLSLFLFFYFWIFRLRLRMTD